MEKLEICRICFIRNVRLYNVLDKKLQDLYEKLTATLFKTGVEQSLHMCYMCYARLRKCYQFAKRCTESQEMLQSLDGNYEQKLYETQENTQSCNSLIATKVVQIDIVPNPLECGVKEESPVLFNQNNGLKLKEETLGNDEEQNILIENVQMNVDAEDDVPLTFIKSETDKLLKRKRRNTTTNRERRDSKISSQHVSDIEFPAEDENHQQIDSDDDLPLTLIKSKSQKQEKRKRVKIISNKDKKKSNTSFKIDALAMMLTKEQQLQDLIARTKSSGYIHAPFKCELCYKAFVDIRAFKNHKLKHDPRSGQYKCDICSLRYKTIQHLRTHSINSHARIFKCNKCEHISRTPSQARVHEKWHSGHVYECQLCSQTFRKPTSHLSHMRKRHPTEHVCNVCGESFVGKHGLQMHKTKAHDIECDKNESSEEPVEARFCKDCNIQFCTVEAWKRHILRSIKHTLSNEQSSECTICRFSCTDSVTLSTHMREHARALLRTRIQTTFNNEQPVRCTQCGGNFMNRAKLQVHINRAHLGVKYNKNIVCEVCGKKCTSNATLKYHQRTHTGEKPYPCTSCSKQFSDSNQLRIHNRTHTGEKPYVCAVCGKRFSQKPALNRHYRVHTGAKPYTCQYCSRTFSQSNSLKLHVRTVHLKQPGNTRKKIQEPIDKKDVEKNDIQTV